MLKIAFFCPPKKIIGLLNQHTVDDFQKNLNVLGVLFANYFTNVFPSFELYHSDHLAK